jgi:hypothetical protein
MCVNAETSLGSFIVGTMLNILIIRKTNNPDYLMLAGIYQVVMLVQFFDFLCWTDLKGGLQNRIGTVGAFLNTLLQPVIIPLILLNFTQVKNKWNKLMVSFILCLYISIVFYNFYYQKYDPIRYLKPTATCKHLGYGWWEMFNKVPAGAYILFTIPIISGLFLLLKSTKFALVHTLYILITGILSLMFYACGAPSMFCLFGAGGPLLNYILMKNNI